MEWFDVPESLRRSGAMRRYAQPALIVGLAVLALLFLLQPLLELPRHVPKDYNEGWNAYHAVRAVNGEALYPRYDDLVSNNYPPVSFYVVGAVGTVIEDDIVAGRAVAFLSLCVVAVSLGLIVRLGGGPLFSAAVAGIGFLGYVAARHGLYVGMNDPQWFAHALMLVGAVVFVASRQRGWLFALAALLMIAAGFVKHTIVPLPIAATIWLALYDRPALGRWVIVSGLVVIVGLGASTVMYGEEFLRGILLDARSYSRSDMAEKIDTLFTPLLPLLGLALVAVPFLWRSRLGVLALLYAAISVVWGTFLMGGKDTDQNVVFDVAISVMLVIGLLMSSSRFATGENTMRLRALVVSIVALTLLPALPKKLYELKASIVETASMQQTVDEDIGVIAGRSGPALCENLSLCYWAGKGFEVDVYLTGQKINAGVIDKHRVIGLIDRHYFSVIQLDGQDGSSFRLPQSVLDAIRARYQLVRTSPRNGSFFVPRSG